MKSIVSSIILFALSASAGAGTCDRPATMDVYPEQWQNAADQFFDKWEVVLAEDVPSHALLHGTMKQLNIFHLARLLKKNGCDVRGVRGVIKQKTAALKSYLVHSDLADLPDEQKASALQRYNYRLAVAKSLSSTETYQAYAEYYSAKDTAYQGRSPDAVRKKTDKDARKALEAERKKLRGEYRQTVRDLKAKHKAEAAAEKAQEKPARKTK